MSQEKPQSKTLRDEIFDFSNAFQTQEFDFKGRTLVFREESVEEASENEKAATGPDGKVDWTKSFVYSIINQVTDKETGKPVCSRADFSNLMKLPSTSGFLKACLDARVALSKKTGGEEEGPLAD